MKASDSGSKVRIARKFVRVLDGTVNLAVLVLLLVLLLYGCYSLWDSRQVYSVASSTQYEIYKPAAGEALSFEALVAGNPDVFGWLTVYGTGIDYPLLQGEDNWEYLNKAADGSYNLAGSIFLDSGNARDFSDYNSLIHGHHMDEGAMFGDISQFSDRTFFDEHKYGALYINGQNYGIVFFAYLLVDAYDMQVYSAPIGDAVQQSAYLQLLESKAMHLREAEQDNAEHIILLNTCSSDMTNGRNILAGYLTEQVYEDGFVTDKPEKTVRTIDSPAVREVFLHIPLWIWMLSVLLVLLLVMILFDIVSKRVRMKRAMKRKSNKKEGNTHDNDE